MRKIILLLIVGFAVSFTACNKIDFNKNKKVNPSDITVIGDKAELQKRITMVNEPITFNSFKSSSVANNITFLGVIAPIPNFTIIYHWVKTDILLGIPEYYNTLNSALPVVTGYTFAAATPATTDLSGNEFSITGVGLDPANSMAYFTSHIRGSKFGGEVFAVSYTGGATPAFLSAEFSIFDYSADYNDLTIDLDAGNSPSNPKLWVAGDNNARGAIVRSAELGLLNLMTVDLQQNVDGVVTPMVDFPMPIMGPSGNSVTIHGNELWFVSGGTDFNNAEEGGLFLYDKTAPGADPIASKLEYHAKHFDMGEFENSSPGEYNGAFLWGNGSYGDNKSNLRIFNTSTGGGSPFNYSWIDYEIDADVTLYGKNAIDVDGPDSGGTQYVYCAMGADGVIKVATVTNSPEIAGDIVDFYKISAAALLDGTGLANGLVVFGDYVYVAYGASGLVVFNKNDLSSGPVAQFDMDLVVTPTVAAAYQGSCNYVAIDENGATSSGDLAILWVGFGTGGMAMFTIEK